MKEKTGHPLCTELHCKCKGNETLQQPSVFVGVNGHAVCACHSARSAEARGVQRFECGEKRDT